MDIGKQIRAARKARKLTQEELAGIVGVSKGAVSQWEKGTTGEIRFHNLLALAEALQVELVESDADVLRRQNSDDLDAMYETTMHSYAPEDREEMIRQLVDQDAVATNRLRRSRATPTKSQEVVAEISPSQWARPTDTNERDVPLLSVKASMGNGIMVTDHVDIMQMARINFTELKSRGVTFSRPENLRLITGLGDSMSPTFNDGDILLVDVGVTELKIDAIYVMERRDELFIKRIQRVPEGAHHRYLMLSDNEVYKPIQIDPERDGYEIRARVLIVWNMRKV